MAATVTIRRWTGAAGAPTKTDITAATTRASLSDSPAPGAATPVPIPAAGTNYSWWVSTRLSVDVTPTGLINNLKWYSDGTNNYGTGVTCKVAKASTGANAGYRQAVTGGADTGLQLLQANHSGLDEVPADAFSFTSGAPKALAGSMANPGTGDLGDFIVRQIEVASTAAPGALTAEQFTYSFDET